LNKRTIFAAGVVFMLSLTYMAIFVSALNTCNEGKAILVAPPDGTKEIHIAPPDSSKAIQVAPPDASMGMHFDGDYSAGSDYDVVGGLRSPLKTID
jgi:hypothetical protein